MTVAYTNFEHMVKIPKPVQKDPGFKHCECLVSLDLPDQICVWTIVD